MLSRSKYRIFLPFFWTLAKTYISSNIHLLFPTYSDNKSSFSFISRNLLIFFLISFLSLVVFRELFYLQGLNLFLCFCLYFISIFNPFLTGKVVDIIPILLNSEVYFVAQHMTCLENVPCALENNVYSNFEKLHMYMYTLVHITLVYVYIYVHLYIYIYMYTCKCTCIYKQNIYILRPPLFHLLI